MKALLITVLMGKVSNECVLVWYSNDTFYYCSFSGTAAFAVISGATLSKHDQRNPSEYDEKSCPRRCSEAYYPMCGINQNGETKVFVNDCYMSMENCNQLTHHGTFLPAPVPVSFWNNFFLILILFQFIIQPMSLIVQILMIGSMKIVLDEGVITENWLWLAVNF